MKSPIGEIKPPKRNVRGKKTRNPGYEAGNHWVECARSGAIIRAKDAMMTWDGLLVCPDDWEPRHPQDFVRGREERIKPEGHIRSESADRFVDKAATEPTSSVPPGTFNNSL